MHLHENTLTQTNIKIDFVLNLNYELHDAIILLSHIPKSYQKSITLKFDDNAIQTDQKSIVDWIHKDLCCNPAPVSRHRQPHMLHHCAPPLGLQQMCESADRCRKKHCTMTMHYMHQHNRSAHITKWILHCWLGNSDPKAEFHRKMGTFWITL